MEIIFVCGSLEPGKDGVGDYTRRLAGELIRKGHITSLISIHDRHSLKLWQGIQEDEKLTVETLRIPAAFSARKRFLEAKKWIEIRKPDWVSLQYVPFAFQRKGIPFGLGKHLKALTDGKKWHIMFHELWVGMDKQATFKMKMWGKAQKYVINSLLRDLQPVAINTQAHLYKAQLNKLGYKVSILPLFSNVPFVPDVSNPSVAVPETNKIIFVVFGSIHFGAPIQQFAKELACFSNLQKSEFKFIFCGRNGRYLEHWIKALEVANVAYEVVGEQPTLYLSNLLSQASFGISTTPLILIEKSGTAAAMREHGLTIINIARDWQPEINIESISPSDAGRLIQYKEGNIKSWITINYTKKKVGGILAVTQQLLNQLLSYS